MVPKKCHSEQKYSFGQIIIPVEMRELVIIKGSEKAFFITGGKTDVKDVCAFY